MNRDELRQFVELKAAAKDVESRALASWIEGAEIWEDELGCVTYLLCLILERRVQAQEECASVIDLIYALEDDICFRIHECDHDFVDYMLRNLREPNLSLEEELVVLHNRMCEHRYDETLRF